MPNFADGYLRTATVGMQNFLQQEVLTMCVCVRVQRTDGRVLGMTDHNADLTLYGEPYEAMSSVGASALRQELGNGVDNLDVIGILRSDRITETDLRVGRFDGAEVKVYLVNWADTSMGGIGPILRGSIGQITIVDGQYTAEVRSLMQRMSQQICELTTPTCTVRQLGDSRCKVDLASVQFVRHVSAVTDTTHYTFDGPFGDTHASGYYEYGRVLWMSGDNISLVSDVKVHTNVSSKAVIQLQGPPPFPVLVNDWVKLEAGCDRTIGICNARFSNTVNFRGFPNIPGSDDLMKRGRPPGST